ncbi:hypothetical protein NDU88_001841 [Pleurodeles waltl]|uniref:Uncharacterized protein n=1 Tax=Pleurodeles waltl TaxID=8319 RepID=A0AAV7NFY4_PLEWA|nr:hypothetical protein NDU88_001841 [Pleurodeles waltl]
MPPGSRQFPGDPRRPSLGLPPIPRGARTDLTSVMCSLSHGGFPYLPGEQLSLKDRTSGVLQTGNPALAACAAPFRAADPPAAQPRRPSSCGCGSALNVCDADTGAN